LRGLAAAISLLFLALVGRPADAALVLTPTVNGQSNAVVQPGSTATVDLLLSGVPGTQHTSSIFTVEFSSPGLLLHSYAWADPYVTGSIFDDSFPSGGALQGGPMAITPGLLAGPGYPDGVSDILFSNVTGSTFGPPPPFGLGLLLSFVIEIPIGWQDFGPISIIARPDTFAIGFDEITTISGQALTITVIPAPSALWLLAAALTHSGSRRRRSLS